MKKGKIVLSAIAMLAITGGIFAFKADSKTNRKLYYISQNGNCLSVGGLTTTAATATTYSTLPAGAVAGWFTDAACAVAPTRKATTIAD